MSTPPLFWSAGSVEWKYEEMSDYWDLCKNGGHVFQTLGQWNPWGDPSPEYCLRCSEKKPEPKKEKTMENLETNMHLFNLLSLEQRMRALVELTTERDKARAARIEVEDGQKSAYDGRYIARVVRESTIDCIINSLIDSTVEKFGGGE